MRLINTDTLELEEKPFEQGRGLPLAKSYAILSHTWGPIQDEVTYNDFLTGDARKRPGFKKVEGACTEAKRNGYKYIWIDSCGIDKSSSAELSEAINSMFQWYGRAGICYAYLSDVYEAFDDPASAIYSAEFRNSRWFTRGWTLQELIAPIDVVFYTHDWQRLASRQELSHVLKLITSIDESVFHTFGTHGHFVGIRMLSKLSIAQRMSWASMRKTTRIEDMAYCLLGLFDVHMSLIYGEGERAFVRLQEEIIKDSDDESIFAWRLGSGQLPLARTTGLLADSPADFAESGHILSKSQTLSSSPWSLTNKGLRVSLQMALCGRLDGLWHWREPKRNRRPAILQSRRRREAIAESRPIYMVTLNCSSLTDRVSEVATLETSPVIWLTRLSEEEGGQYARIFPQDWFTMNEAASWAGKPKDEKIYVRKNKRFDVLLSANASDPTFNFGRRVKSNTTGS